ncbi:MAG: hypothetical protein ACRDFB_00360 [Rhabdochlamydiaceae bacterium]
MRELIINQIKGYGWLDSHWDRYDNRPYDAQSYENWLKTLSNEDLLCSYNWIRDREAELD